MQKIKRCSLSDAVTDHCIVVGPPCDDLLRLQKKGKLVLCELKHLQGLSEEEIANIIKEDSSLWQYEHICIDVTLLPEAYFERIWYRHKGLPVVVAKTQRLIIRESIKEDAAAFQELYADKDVQTYLELPPITQLMQENSFDKEQDAYETYIAQYAEHQYNFYEYGMWSVVEKDSGVVIGRAGLEMQCVSEGSEAGEEKLSLGYALLPQYRGKGYALEACLAILDYCKECDYASEVFVKINEKNTKSNHLLQKLCEYDKVVVRKI